MPPDSGIALIKHLSTILRITLARLVAQIGGGCSRLSRMLHQTTQEKRVIPWFDAHGDTTHRVDYDLNESSVVIDLGGFEGEWASNIFSRYCCTIHIFEPVPRFAETIRKRFAKNPRIHLHPVGISHYDHVSLFHVDADSSSAFRRGTSAVPLQLMDAVSFFTHAGLSQIDLMKINIEGGEYDLLETLVSTNYIARFRNIQVQFHDFVPNAFQRMRAIQDSLKRTHQLTFQYEFVWENWQAIHWPPR